MNIKGENLYKKAEDIFQYLKDRTQTDYKEKKKIINPEQFKKYKLNIILFSVFFTLSLISFFFILAIQIVNYKMEEADKILFTKTYQTLS
ncbi:UNVERIFIED_CONTAM: hypothetical protein O8I53_06070 [Campylobacter lari]